PHLAEPALALRGLPAKIPGSEGADPARGRVPHGAQPGQPGRTGGRAEPAGGPPRGGHEPMAEGKLMNPQTLTAEDLLAEAARWRDEGRQVALATVVQTWGSSPRPVGSQLIVDDRLRLQGSVSGGCIEGAVVHEAQAIMAGAPPK